VRLRSGRPLPSGFRILSDEQQIIVSDVPRLSTIFGLVFVCSGLFVLTIAPRDMQWSHFVLWEKLAVAAIGLAHFAVGCWLVSRRLDTTTSFDHATGKGMHVVRRPWFGEPTVTRFRLDDVRAIEIVPSKDSDGDPMYQLVLWLSGSRRLALQQPDHGLARAESRKERLVAELGLAETAPVRSIRT
jgi:hypothetical protein